jgi:hypothetical protein
MLYSLTWGDEEVTGKGREKNGYSKIKAFCSEAKQAGYKYRWVDTCCI